MKKKQVILHGPKGSGKRQLAKKFKFILYITLKNVKYCLIMFKLWNKSETSIR